MDIFDKIFSELNADESVEKTAETETKASKENTTEPEVSEGVNKLAADLEAAGRIVAEGMFARWQEKLAMAVPASGGGIEPRSTTEQIAKKIAVQKGQKAGAKSGDMSVRAEGHDAMSGDMSVRAEGHDAMSGAKGDVNKSDYRG